MKTSFFLHVNCLQGRNVKSWTERKIDIILIKYLDLKQYGFVFWTFWKIYIHSYY